MRLPSSKVCKRIRDLHQMLGSSSETERETALKKLHAELEKHGLRFTDVREIVDAIDAVDRAKGAAPPSPPDRPADDPEADQINVYSLVRRLFEVHIYCAPEEHAALALWTLHTWAFDRFTHSPRLALISPVRGCGKTETLALIELLVRNPWRSDDVSAASIYRQSPLPVFLLDEFDQANLRHNSTLKAVLHSGWRVGGSVSRVINGWPTQFEIFTPVALAAIGAHSLSLPLLDRSIVINMSKAPPDAKIERIDVRSPVFTETRRRLEQWALTAQLNPNPEMAGLILRPADNWRTIFSIADSLGAGEEARAAALKLKANRADVDPGVALLYDIRIVFRQRGVDRFAKTDLVAALHELNEYWLDWDDDRPGRKLTHVHLSRLLRTLFQIRSKTVWPLGERATSKSHKGYTRDQFENAWRQYCPEDDTPAQAKETIRLVKN